MDEEGGDYRFDICSSCLWRAGDLLPLCDACDEGDQYEEAELADGEEPWLKKVIPIVEMT